MEEEEWTVAEEVEERPRDEDGEEDDHGDPMPKEVEDEDEERDERVVHVEVIEVALDASGGFAECVREREGGNGWMSSRHGRHVVKTERVAVALAVVVDVEGSVL